MIKTFNRVMGVFGVGSDGEVRTGTTGEKEWQVTSFSAVSDRWDAKAKKKVSTWWKVTVFGDRVPKIVKGQRVAIVGEAYLEEWNDKQFLKINAESVEVLSGQVTEEKEPEKAGTRVAYTSKGGKLEPAADQTLTDDQSMPF